MTTESKSTAEKWQQGENWLESMCKLKAKTFQNIESEQVWPDGLQKVIDARLCKTFFMRFVALGYQYLFTLLAMCCRNNPRRQNIVVIIVK